MIDDLNAKLAELGAEAHYLAIDDANYIAKLLADGKREVDIDLGEKKAWLANALPSYAELLDYAALMKRSFELLLMYATSTHTIQERMEFGAKVYKKRQALKNVATKLENDPRQKAKLSVKADWDRWQAYPSDYATQTEFIDDMEKHYPAITRRKSLEEWCAKWNKEKPPSAS